MKFEQITNEPGQSETLPEKLDSEQEILSCFTPEQQKEIKEKQKILSSLAYFIGKDFQIPVELNKAGEGWHWDFKDNIIRIDPKDLLEKPMDYLRFVISHEGGHRRISRTDFIPVEVWQQKGFSFLMNVIEDPRDNNFVAANYPRFAEQMKLAYDTDLEQEKIAKTKAKETLGYQPRFMQAGFEFIKLWYKERMKKSAEVSVDLPEEIKEVVKKTITSASDAWRTYPTKELADKGGKPPSGQKVNGEGMIREYAKLSYEIILEEIWPEFKELVEQDLQDQKMAELMKDLQKEKQEGKGLEKGESGDGLPKELKDKLTPEEQKELEKAIEKALEEAKKEKGKEKEGEEDTGKSKAVDMDSLSPELKKKIKDFIDGLPDEKKKELAEKAEKAMKDFEGEVKKEMEGKLTENPEERGKREKMESEEREKKEKEETGEDKKGKKDDQKEVDDQAEIEKQKIIDKEIKRIRDEFEKIADKDEGLYDKTYEKVANIINGLTNDLRNVFRDRKKDKMHTGKKSGSRINIGRRITELAEKILPIESRAWERRSAPDEKDYAIGLLVDLSGSMRGNKMTETFKAVVVLAEVLNKLGIKTEILGFNDKIYEYLNFGEKITKSIRENMATMPSEVSSHGANWNDDGWALEQASKRLNNQREKVKILISLSDGVPEPSTKHADWDLAKVISGIMEKMKIKLIGLGIGSGTGHVSSYYPKSIANVSVEEMAEQIANVLKEAIVNYD